MSSEGRLLSDYRLRVQATGDDVGNNGSVLVYRRNDGTITLTASRRAHDQTLWLTRQQALDLGLALLNAASAPARAAE